MMDLLFTPKSVGVYAELFINLSAGFFGTLIIFPGVIGIKSFYDILGLLFINLSSGILCLLIALKLKTYE